MNKVVKTGLKIDLHIHSAASAHKDGVKVKNNTLENIGTLIEKLNDNEVNLCSITDHDTFSYEMYQGLKVAESMDNSIQKVLPGVEFSVCFASECKESVIHVVTIFTDEDEVKVQKLESILKNNRPNYNDAYREEEFLALLREVDMNTILIAHQKNTLTSRNPRKNDANSLGNQRFLEFVYTDYFEAFEFKNRRNEVLNKTFLFQKDMEQNRFKNMGEVRQVIMVTHNPQFIVNLDVDNLIFLSKDESGLKIRSGALEYECPEYNILDIVAQNIDGGLDSIRKRWKRYEKATIL